MKKGFWVFAWLLMGLCLYGMGDEPVAVLMGNFPAPEGLSELGLIHDGSGGVYILCIAGGEVTIVRRGVDGAFEPYHPAGFPGGLRDARQLRLNDSGPVQYAAFIGAENGIEALYVLGLDDQAELSYYPLAETKTAASISRYALTVTEDGAAAVFALSEGRLYLVSGIGRAGGIPAALRISSTGDTVGDFGITGDYRQRHIGGWYTNVREGKTEVNLFLRLGNALLLRKPLGSYTGLVRVRGGMTMSGETTVKLINGNRVALYRNSEAGIMPEAAFEAPSPVLRYFSTAETGGSRGLLLGGDEGKTTVYGVVHENSGAPEFPAYVTIEQGFIAEIFFTGERRIALLYNENHAWYAAAIDIDRGFEGKEIIPGAGKYLNLFFETPAEGRLYFTGDDAGETLGVYEFTQGGSGAPGWKKTKSPVVPEAILREGIHWDTRPAADSPPVVHTIFPLMSDSGLILYDPGSEKFQALGLKRYAWSRRINGTIYLAGYTGDTVSLYRMEE
jgi:hypothetical protein